MPLIECPLCHYRTPIRSERLTEFNQCLRCTSRFVPQQPLPRKWSGILAAGAGVAVVSVAAIAWAIIRSS